MRVSAAATHRTIVSSAIHQPPGSCRAPPPDELSSSAFAENHYYSPISRAEFHGMYARLRPLVERSALAVADVVAELDKLAPKPLPDTEKAVPAA